MFEDAAHLTVLAFRQRQLDPLVASGTAFEVGVDLAVADAVDGDALDQILELRLADVAEGARAIGALDPARGQFELALERAVVGEEQQPFGIIVESTDRHQRSEEHTSELQSLMRTSYAVFCLQKKRSRS